MIKSIIFDGKLPYLKLIRKFISLATFSALAIFFIPREFSEFGEIGWNLLLFVVFIRPLADLLPKLKILRTLSMLRKELGIMSGVFIIAHSLGYLVINDLPITSHFYDGNLWNFSSGLGWGSVGLFTVFILLLTSNNAAIRLLKKHWKPVQRLTYLLFLSGAIHIALIENEPAGMIAIVISFIVLWVLSAMKVKLWQ